MRIGAINQVSYKNRITKTSFKKNNNITPLIDDYRFAMLTPNQMQAFSGVRFKGEEASGVVTFTGDISSNDMLENSASKKSNFSTINKIIPNFIKVFEKAFEFKTPEQIEIFINLLGDKIPEIFAYALTIQDENGNTLLHVANTDETKAFTEALGDKAPETYVKALIIQNKDGKTLLHGVSVDKINVFAEALGDKASEAFVKALAIQDKDGKTPLHTANSDETKAFRKALGDKAPETFAKVLAIQNKDENALSHAPSASTVAKYSNERVVTRSDKNKTDGIKVSAEAPGRKAAITHSNKTTKTGTSKSILLKRCFFERTSIEDIKEVFSSNPDELEEFILEERDYPALDLATPRQIQVFSEILGDRAPEIIEKALPIQSISGKTPLHDPNHNKVEVFAWILNDKTPEIFSNLLTVQDKDGRTPLHWAGPYKTEALAKALGGKAPEVFAEVLKIQDKDGNTPLHLASPDVDSIFIKALRDKAPEILPKLLAIQNKDGNTPLHLAGPHSIEVYAKALGANTDKIFDKILLIKNNHGMLAIYPSGCHPDKLIALNNAAPSAIKRALKEKYGSETYKDIWLRELKDRCDTYIKFIQHPRLVWFDETDYKANYDSWKKFLNELAK